jgi:protocatechuate 3,4-dioxygenase beta subunit
LKTSQTSQTPSRALALLACAALFFAVSVLDCRAQQPATTSNTQTTQAASANAAGDSTARAADANKSARAADYITGRVVGEGGEPLGGVNVYASPRSLPVPGTRHVAVADDDGAFRIRGLEPGIYTISAYVPGYVPEPDPLTGRVGGEYKPGDSANVRLVRGGVITGTITDAQGQAVVAIGVRAFRVRDLDGRAPLPYFNYDRTGRTDDRGVYRLYGLLPGVYVVVAGGAAANNFGVVTPYQTDVPTFYPSSTRDTAAEITVRAGQESAGVDIRYREEQGHRVTGRVEFAAPLTEANGATSITLSYASSGMTAGSAFVNPATSDNSFSFEAIGDGDYDLQATGGGRDGLPSAAPPLRVTVRGADVVGLRVRLTPLASASGTVLIERADQEVRARAECKDMRAPLPPQETLVVAAFDRPASARPQPIPRVSPTREAEPDEAGAFTLRSLEPGRYHLIARPFDENLYVRSIDVPAATPNAQRDAATSNARRGDAAPARQQRAPAPSAAAQPQSSGEQAARALLDLKPGQQTGGINVRLSEGAAGLSGRVAAAEGAPAPPYASLRVHLLPAEREHAEDALRFFETTTNADGSFSFKNLPPGRYLLLARPAADPTDAVPRPAAWDADTRAKLRAEAEAAGTTVELQPCQRTTDFTIRFPPSAPK